MVMPAGQRCRGPPIHDAGDEGSVDVLLVVGVDGSERRAGQAVQLFDGGAQHAGIRWAPVQRRAVGRQDAQEVGAVLAERPEARLALAQRGEGQRLP